MKLIGKPTWQDGWLDIAKQLPSPNFNARPIDSQIDLIVVHSISLPPAQYGGGFVQALFCNSLEIASHPYFQTLHGLKVSSHFFVERTGAIWQFVSAHQRAWHAGISAFLGLENCNNFSIGIELEGLEGEFFEPAQYASLSILCQALKTEFPIRHVVGHEHIAPGRKNDPGTAFDWVRLQKMTNWPTRYFPVISSDGKSANSLKTSA